MALETGSFIDDLVITNPLGADAKNKGDDHLRLVKKVVKATFPGMTGAAWRVQTKTGTYTVVAGDNMTAINCTTALTLNLTAAATLGNQHLFLVIANGGDVTVDPDGAETINGSATLQVADGETATIVCTGSEFLGAVAPATTPSTVIPATTVMLFHQSAAPTGWTKDVASTLDNAALRVVASTAWASGKSGATAFDSVFGSSKNAGDTTLTAAQSGLPAHLHASGNGGAFLTDGPGGPSTWATGAAANTTANTASDTAASAASRHNHTLSLDLNYINLILATKD